MDKVKIVQRNLGQRNALSSLTLQVSYGEGVEAEATILLRPGAVPNEEKSIRQEIERLGRALQAAAQSPNGVEG